MTFRILLATIAIAFAASAQAQDDRNHTGLYWNPDQPGWGMHLTHQGNTIFATVFSYVGGRPVWLVASDVRRTEPNFFDGSFHHTRGTRFDADAWSLPTLQLGGRFWLRFSGADEVTVGLIAGPMGMFSIISLRKQVFASPPTCVSTAGSREGATNYQDLWWNPAESGWGLSLAHQGDIIFATLFIYNRNGEPEWVVGSHLAGQPDGSFSGLLYRGTGGGSYTEPTRWTPPAFAQVGEMRLEFASGTRGTLRYTLGGVSRTKAIQRQVFGLTTPLCR